MFVHVHCMYIVYHGNWRDFGTAAGKVFIERLFDNCSVRFAHTAHASLMGAYAPKRSANRALSEIAIV